MENRITRIDIPQQKDGSKQQSSRNTQATSPTPAQLNPGLDRDFRENRNDLLGPVKKAGPPRDLTLPSILESSKEPGRILRNESPWKKFKKVYGCDLADEVMVVVKKSKPENLYLLKRFPGEGLDEIFHRLSSIQHTNVAFAKNCFATTEGLFTLSDFAPLTLGNIVACRHYPDIEQLNAIMAQVNLILSLINFIY